MLFYNATNLKKNVYKINIENFNLDYTLSCGQVFRWEKKEKWSGVVNGEVIKATQEGNELIIDSKLDKNYIMDYFRLNDDMEKIYSSISKDDKISPLINKYRGLRLIHQEPWECLISYMCSSRNKISNIKSSIKTMSMSFGEKIEDNYYSFPTPDELSKVTLSEFSKCRLSFRTPYIMKVASQIADGEFDIYGIKKLSYEEGKNELLKLKGVGNKIADCVLLFAFEKFEAFPVDTHIEQIMDKYYGINWKNVKKSKKKERIGDFAREYFGKYCGYAQEYLFLEDCFNPLWVF